MTVFYIDFEDGNDANNGLNFGNRKKTIEYGVVGLPGDEFRLKASPYPIPYATGVFTCVGEMSGTFTVPTRFYNKTPITVGWASGVIIPFKTGDLVHIYQNTHQRHVNGVWEITNLRPTGLDLVGSAHVEGGVPTGILAAGMGIIRPWNNRSIILSNSQVYNLDYGEIRWSGNGGNITSTITSASLLRQGTSSASLAIAAGFSTGKIAHVTLTPSGVDLSDYNALSLNFRASTVAVTTSGMYVLNLCTDKNGDNIAFSVRLPSISGAAINHVLTIPYSGGTHFFGSEDGTKKISSLALYASVDPGTPTLIIDNVIACKYPSGLTLNSLIALEDTGIWYPIRSIERNVVTLETHSPQTVNSPTIGFPRGIFGSNYSGLIYIRQPLPNISSNIIKIGGDGISGVKITGGWNRTDMSTIDGMTFLDGINNGSVGIKAFGGTRSNVEISNIGLLRYTKGISLAEQGQSPFWKPTFNNIQISNCTVGAICYNEVAAGDVDMAYFATGINIINNAAYGIDFTSTQTTAGIKGTIFDNLRLENNGGGMQLYGVNGFTIKNLTLNNCSGMADGVINLANSYKVTINDISSMQYCKPGITLESYCSDININRLRNVKNNDSVLEIGHLGISQAQGGGEIRIGLLQASGNINTFKVHTGGKIRVKDLTAIDSVTGVWSTFNLNKDASIYINNNEGSGAYIWNNFGEIRQDYRVVATTGVGKCSWNIQPKNLRLYESSPLSLNLPSVAVNANTQVTANLIARRDNSNLNLFFVLPGFQISGIPDDIRVQATGVINEWERLSMSFTPTESGVVGFQVHAYSGITYNGWVDDLSITQV